MIKIYHNKMCSKSCAALDLLNQSQIELQVQEYLYDVPSKAELIAILKLLQMKPFELIRQNESLFQQQFASLILSDEDWLEIMLKHPILIERPIIIKDGKAIIGRPLEKVINLL
ncbi:arsenate reductase family protein [Sphingobacterium sp. SYP-B4668]|uniref:arsenate reductase family protein n=1 Tax=Sphingobacterium sp. SYP-B4668 TaxID=2996035 RepID=UPI0005323601|nr:arsenate reductase family protein [Sphingobacterium sp. SYP-B4668]